MHKERYRYFRTRARVHASENPYTLQLIARVHSPFDRAAFEQKFWCTKVHQNFHSAALVSCMHKRIPGNDTKGITGILLAAGMARRFGSHKLLARLPDGEPVGLHAARTLLQAVPQSVAVVRPGDQELSELLRAAGLQLMENPNPTAGIAGSIRSGIAATTEANGWLIALADMPWIQPTTIRSVAVALNEGASLAAPTFNGVRGHPVGFSARWRSRLLSLQGDKGARDLLEDAADELIRLPTNDAGILADIDLPVDLIETIQNDAAVPPATPPTTTSPDD